MSSHKEKVTILLKTVKGCVVVVLVQLTQMVALKQQTAILKIGTQPLNMYKNRGFPVWSWITCNSE